MEVNLFLFRSGRSDCRVGLTLVVTAAVFVAAGCRTSRSWSANGIERLRESDRAYRVGDYSSAEALTTQVIDEFPDDRRVAAALYIRGLSRIRQSRRSEAVGDLRRALRISWDDELTASVVVQLANIAFDDESYDEAAKLYEQAARRPPRSVGADRLWFRYGVSLIRNGRFDAARGAFRRLVASHPESRFAALARRKLAWHRDHFSVQCGAFAEARSAGEAARTLRSEGIDASVSRLPRGQQLPFVVHSGRYGSYEAAKTALAAIRSHRNDAFIVP